MFPSCAHDDMVDSMTQAAAWLLQVPDHTVEIYNAFTGERLT
jgi:phage terminase large subunit-like protein